MRICLPPQRLRFRWKGVHSFCSCAQRALLVALLHTALACSLCAPCSQCSLLPVTSLCTRTVYSSEFRTTYAQDLAPKKKGAKELNRKARLPEVHHMRATMHDAQKLQ